VRLTILGLALLLNVSCPPPKNVARDKKAWADYEWAIHPSPNSYCTVDYFVDQLKVQEPGCYARMQKSL
jgi:hypothetical protein